MNSGPEISSTADRTLFDEYAPMARRIARDIARGMPSNVELEDLTQDGLLGLVDAIIRCNKEMTAQQFRSFAATRVRGAVMDGLRGADWGLRRVRREMRRVEAATQKLGHLYGRAPSEGEVARELGVPLRDYQTLLQEAHGYFLLSLDDLDEDDPDQLGYLEHCASSETDPLVVLERAAFRSALANVIMTLPDKEFRIMCLYYEEGMTLREIGEALGLSEGRICQLHAQAIARLRASFVGGADRPSILKPRRKPR